tara:strand:- start:224 stop:346 length:123 start_codon:yes stop_codon:yes gene_type:complete
MMQAILPVSLFGFLAFVASWGFAAWSESKLAGIRDSFLLG